MPVTADRVQRAQDQMDLSGEAAIIVSGAADGRWLCGDEESGPLLLDRDGAISRGMPEIDRALAALGRCRVGIDPDMTAGQLLRVQRMAVKSGVKVDWQSTKTLAACRAIKDAAEIAIINRAASITRTVIDELADIVRPGVSEMELSNWLSVRIRELGADGFAFEPSIGSGPRGAASWAGVTLRHVAEGEPVVIDCGAMVDGYHSDMTRTYIVGRAAASGPVQRMADAAMATMERVTEALGPGMPCRDLHSLAQATFREHRWQQPMPHALGHGVGLQLHERPYVSSRSSDVLAAGMVVAIEPGAYDDELGGFRTEDMFVITSSGAERLGQEVARAPHNPGITGQECTPEGRG